MKNQKKFILIAIMLSVFGAAVCSAGTAGVTFGNINISPSSPAALSTITISIEISDETPSEVRVTVEECNGHTGVCYPDIQNVSLSLLSAGNYETDVTLKHADATYITCQVVAKISGTWESSARKNFTLSENTNGNTDGNGDNNTPGFEVILFVIAVGVSLIVIGRKRFK